MPRAVVLALACVLATSCTAAARGRAPVRFDPRPYYSATALRVLHGQASYYADSLAGNPTASGERYDPQYFTAAHRSLPLGTIVRVTAVRTGRWVLVRVNDRGPFGSRTRILDLSKAAARELRMLRAGVIAVRAEILAWGKPQPRRRR